VGALDEVIFCRVGEGVDGLGEDVVRSNEVDDRGFLCGPAIFPAPAVSVLMLGQVLVKILEKDRQPPFDIHDDHVVMVGVCDEGHNLDTRSLSSDGQTVDEGVVGLRIVEANTMRTGRRAPRV
jgi:hypothetical protein